MELTKEEVKEMGEEELRATLILAMGELEKQKEAFRRLHATVKDLDKHQGKLLETVRDIKAQHNSHAKVLNWFESLLIANYG